MSKESYARGFCKAAAAAGVDPIGLVDLMKKTAWGEKGTSAGIGTYDDNNHAVSPSDETIEISSHANPGAYLPSLFINATGSDKPISTHSPYGESMIAAYGKFHGSPNDIEDGKRWKERPFTKEDLLKFRRNMAEHSATSLFPRGTDPWKEALRTFIEAGENNERSWKETGAPIKRTNPPKTNLKLDGKRLQQYLQLLNGQARSGATTKSNIA